MRIAWFGSSLLSAYWNGAATYYRGIIRALNGLGHQITFYEPDAYGRQERRDISEPDWARVVVYSSEGEAHALVEQARHADVVIKASGVGVFEIISSGSGVTAALMAFKATTAPSVSRTAR